MVYLSRAAFSDWLATTTPANIFSAAAFFLAFNAPEDEQVSLLGMQSDEVAEKLRAVDINTMTPIEALNLVYQLKKLVE